ncbi:hypothetical protein HMPREF9127_0331 [Parvimonas sp. oral taxon 393 str. F0440]|nr:hypothetical protein HMPREF9127_0331 [Parvimonas sp. oral taxon 393 str. F0440]
MGKDEVVKLGKAAENYVKNVKASRGEKTEEKNKMIFLMRVCYSLFL